MIEFNEKMEKAIQGLFFSYHDSKPIWLTEWEDNHFKIYSDVIEISDIKIKHHFAAFISSKKGELNYLARVRRDKNVVTKKTRVFFEKVLELKIPVKFNDVLSHSSPQMKNSLRKMINSDFCEITANQWNAIVSYLFNYDKEQHKLIKEILHTKKIKTESINNKTIITNHEKDAIGLCLRIAGINNQFNNIASWDTEITTTPDFLKNIKNVSLREDQMIINDFKFFDNWELVNEFKNNVAVFSDGINRVSIMNANRTPIETTLGVDLFYFNHIYKNYIFVQYKRLIKTESNYKFNIKSDSNFLKDLERMSILEKELENNSKSLQFLEDYRLSKEMFYFKFCKENQDILTKDLSTGMYLPKSFINEFVNTFNQKTVSYENIDRYFNNTMFIEMVKSGLFGSKFNDSTKISKLINEIIATGKSVMIAVKNMESFDSFKGEVYECN